MSRPMFSIWREFVKFVFIRPAVLPGAVEEGGIPRAPTPRPMLIEVGIIMLLRWPGAPPLFRDIWLPSPWVWAGAPMPPRPPMLRFMPRSRPMPKLWKLLTDLLCWRLYSRSGLSMSIGRRQTAQFGTFLPQPSFAHMWMTFLSLLSASRRVSCRTFMLLLGWLLDDIILSICFFKLKLWLQK